MTKPRPWSDAELKHAREYLQVDKTSPSGLSWKRIKRGVSGGAGSQAGWVHSNGYWWVSINKRRSQAGRWVLLLSGDIPEDRRLEVEHIDGNPKNNKLENLRWAADDSDQSLHRHYDCRTGLRWAYKQSRHESYFFQFVIPRTSPAKYVRKCGFPTAQQAHFAAIRARRALNLPVPKRLATIQEA